MAKKHKIKIVSNKMHGTKIYQGDKEILAVVGYELFQNDPTKMPIIRLDILAPEVEAILEECEREDTIIKVTTDKESE